MSVSEPDRLGQLISEALVRTASGERGRAPRRVAREARRALVALRDPVVRYALLGSELRLRLSHDLPVHRAEHPGYSDNLRRVATRVNEKHPDTTAVDVGANIGDSVLFLRSAGYEQIIAIEPAPEFLPLLRRNVGALSGVVVEEVMLAGSARALHGSIVTRRGTGHWVDGGEVVRTATLDDLMTRHRDLGPVSLVKTDTDGFDLDILHGAETTLAGCPTLFFEYDPRRWALAPSSGLDFIAWLESLGYGSLLFYDGVGTLVTTTDIGDTRRHQELDAYARTTSVPYFYFDIAAFSRDDADVADAVRAGELPPY